MTEEQRPHSDRILVLTGVCLVLIVSSFRILTDNASKVNELGRVVVIEATMATPSVENPSRVMETATTLPDLAAAFAHDPEQLEFGSEIFFSDAELSRFGDLHTQDLLFEELAPPLDLSWNRQGSDVGLTWMSNPANAAILGEVRQNPTLTIEYLVYRWRTGTAPSIVGTVSLEKNSFDDLDLGIQGGQVFYSVMTILKGRIGERETLIESERSPVLEALLDDAFELNLLGFDAGKAPAELSQDTVIINVTVFDGGQTHTAKFAVISGDTVGATEPVDTRPKTVDFDTGLRVTDISEVGENREERVQHPVFNPDGSRTFDETGFLFREEKRMIPIRRLEVRLESEAGKVRVLTLDRPDVTKMENSK